MDKKVESKFNDGVNSRKIIDFFKEVNKELKEIDEKNKKLEKDSKKILEDLEIRGIKKK